MTSALLLRSETKGIRPEFDHARGHARRPVLTEDDALSPRSRQINERSLRRYTPSWKKATPGQRILLLEAWKAAHGPVLPMAYTPVGKTDSDQHDVRFVDDTLRIRRQGPAEWEMSVDVEEVR